MFALETTQFNTSAQQLSNRSHVEESLVGVAQIAKACGDCQSVGLSPPRCQYDLVSCESALAGFSHALVCAQCRSYVIAQVSIQLTSKVLLRHSEDVARGIGVVGESYCVLGLGLGVGHRHCIFELQRRLMLRLCRRNGNAWWRR